MAVTQNPASIVTVGFNNYSFTGACPTGVTLTHGAEIEHIVCNGEFKTSVIKNKSHTVKFDAVVLASSPTVVAGDTATLNSIVYLITGVTYTYSDGAARISIDGIKHADANYTA